MMLMMIFVVISSLDSTMIFHVMLCHHEEARREMVRDHSKNNTQSTQWEEIKESHYLRRCTEHDLITKLNRSLWSSLLPHLRNTSRVLRPVGEVILIDSISTVNLPPGAIIWRELLSNFHVRVTPTEVPVHNFLAGGTFFGGSVV